MSLAYIRSTYGVPARRGTRVVALGRTGHITSSDGTRLRIRLDGERRSRVYHPTWRIQYPNWSRRELLRTRPVVTTEVPGVSR